MKHTFIIYSMLLSLIIVSLSCTRQDAPEIVKTYPESFALTLENSLVQHRTDETVTVDIEKLRTKYPAFNPHAAIFLAGEKELPAQAIDINNDGQADQMLLVADFEPQEKKAVIVRYAKSGEVERNYSRRTQAELSVKVGGTFVDRKYEGGTFQNVTFLRVPPEHTDHSLFIRYEGPGWESDRVGYRFYLDWRNATDIFGKKTPEMVLQNVGQDGFDSYHEMADWGMDILKVGESLGIGSLAMWVDDKAQRVAVTDSITCEIAANGSLYSQVRTRYFGWEINGEKYDLTSDLSITAGSRLTRHDIAITGAPENLCTGIVKHPDAKLLQKAGAENGWSYLATYGKQSLAEDNLGMAILYRTADLIALQEDAHSHVVLLFPANGRLAYYFLAAWEKEPGGIHTKAQFMAYLDDLVAEMDAPVKASF